MRLRNLVLAGLALSLTGAAAFLVGCAHDSGGGTTASTPNSCGSYPGTVQYGSTCCPAGWSNSSQCYPATNGTNIYNNGYNGYSGYAGYGGYNGGYGTSVVPYPVPVAVPVPVNPYGYGYGGVGFSAGVTIGY